MFNENTALLAENLRFLLFSFKQSKLENKLV